MADTPDHTNPFGDEAFRQFMEGHSAPSDEAVAVPDLTALRGRMDQFKALGDELASVLGDFRKALRRNDLPEEDVAHYSRLWGTAYMNVLFTKVIQQNGGLM